MVRFLETHDHINPRSFKMKRVLASLILSLSIATLVGCGSDSKTPAPGKTGTSPSTADTGKK
jgi:hypothetical protein